MGRQGSGNFRVLSAVIGIIDVLLLVAITNRASVTITAAHEALAPTATPQLAASIIAYTSLSSKPPSLHLLNVDTNGDQGLVTSVSAYDPNWSPDGKQIAFTSEDDFDIYVVNGDGQNVRRLTDCSNCGFHGATKYPHSARIAWSPNAKQLVFESNYEGEGWGISLINSDGSGRRLLTKYAYGPVWSPNGLSIAFSKLLTTDNGQLQAVYRIYTIRSDGTQLHRMSYTEKPCNETPRWSPDGKKIAFLASTACGIGINSDIYTVKSDGTDDQLIVGTHTVDSMDWSPNGNQIVFADWDNNRNNIFTVDLGTRVINRLTSSDSRFYPQWSPDGNRIAFFVRVGDDFMEDLYINQCG